MNLRERQIVGPGLVVGMLVLSVAFYSRLPVTMVIHWGPGGPDGTASRLVALGVLPLLAGALILLFEVLPRIDPLGHHLRDLGRYYDVLVVVIVGLLAYVHGLVILWNLGTEFDVLQAIVPAVAILLYVVGEILEHVDKNWFVGIRTPWTLSSERVWEETHASAGPLFKLAAALALPAILFPEYGVVFLAGPVLAISAYLTVYSYLAYRRLESAPDDNV